MAKVERVKFRKLYSNPATGKRETIYFGWVSPTEEKRANEYINRLITCKRLGMVPDETVQRWAMGLSDGHHEKLAATGLVAPKERTTIGGFIEAFIKRRERAVKPSTVTVYRQESKKLLEYFGADRRPETITLKEAEEFAAHLREKGYAEASVDKTFKECRLFFNEMVEHGILPKNVFSKVRTSDKPNESRNEYITRGVIDRVIDAGCPDAEWRAFVALMRYGGMRCPSEVLLLRWSDVDFTGEMGFFDGIKTPAIKFRSVKTEHHKGGASRTIPMFRELRPHLEELWEMLPEGENRPYVIWSMLPAKSRESEPRRLKKNFGKAFKGILKKLGIEPWEKLFVNLRRSCRNDLERSGYPTRVINEWMGHSEKVANVHYVQILPEDLNRAAFGREKEGEGETDCAQNCAQQGEKGAIRGANEKRNPLVFKHQTQGVTRENNEIRSGRT